MAEFEDVAPGTVLTAEQAQEITPSGVFTEDESGFEDYFSFGGEFTYSLPDGKQYIKFKQMSEGDRVRYQKATSRDVKIDRHQNANIKTDPGEDRWKLIEFSCTDWYMVARNKQGGWAERPFSVNALRTWLSVANPKLVSELEAAIREQNPWMTDDMSVEDVDEEIERLTEIREKLVKRDEGKAGS